MVAFKDWFNNKNCLNRSLFKQLNSKIKKEDFAEKKDKLDEIKRSKFYEKWKKIIECLI